MHTFALVTGASGGIGYELAFELARQKRNVLLVARSAEKLGALKQVLIDQFQIQCDFISLDLSAPESAHQVYQWCLDNHYEVDILVNNAGYGIFGYFHEQELSEIENMIQLNIVTLVQLTHAFLPMLRSKSQAYILNVASTTSYQAVPTFSVYAASKAFVVLFTRGLRHELKGSTVSVSCLSPGTTATNFIERARLTAIKEKADKFSMSAKAVATIAIRGMFASQAEIIPAWLNWISAKLTGFVPKSLTENIAAGLYKDALKKP